MAPTNNNNPPLSIIESVASDIDDGYETPIEEYPQEKSKVVGEIGTRRGILGSIPSFFGRSRSSRASTVDRSSTASHLAAIPESTSSSPPPLHSDGPRRGYHTPVPSVGSTLVPPTPPRGDTINSSASPPPPRNFSSPTPSKSIVGTASGYGSEKEPANSIVRATTSHTNHSNPESRFSWHQTNPEKVKSAFTRWFVEWWMFEIACWIFSLICMGVILGVLLHYDNKPIPRWNAGMTLNSFVAVLAGFGRAALLIPTAEALGQLKWNWFTRKSRRLFDFEVLDGASRGPWGSFMLLARSKGITLSSLGATIVLLTVPLDLFFQQIVSYRTVWIESPLNATLRRATTYDNTNFNRIVQGEIFLVPDQAFGAVENNFFTKSIPIETLYFPECPTGNCTWPAYDTLAISSSCTDVSNLLTFGCQNSSGYWLPLQDPSATIPLINTCGYYADIPDPVQAPLLMSGYYINETNQIDVVLSSRYFNFMEIINQTFIIPNGSINYKHIQNPLVDFLVSVTPGDTAGALRNATPSMYECEAHYVVRTVQASYIDGNFTETNITEQFLVTNDWWNPWPDPATFLPSFYLNLPDSTSPSGFTNFSVPNLPAQATIGGIQVNIPSIFFENITIAPEYADLPTGVLQKASMRSNFFDISKGGNPFAHSGLTPSEIMAKFSQSLTNVLRNTPTDGTLENFAEVDGTAFTAETRVHLRWAYATLPAALLLFSLIFLINVIVTSSHKLDTIGIWKTSALAVLFNGLGEQEAQEINSKIKMGNARSRAKKMDVMLEE